MNYPYRREPRDHQREFFERTRDLAHVPLFWEQRTRKSKVIVDTVAYRFMKGDINAVLIIAPNGTHRDWVVEHFPLDLPELVQWKGVVWQSSRMSTRYGKIAMEELLVFQGLSILTMNVEALNMVGAKQYLGRFLRQRCCLVAIDESDCIADRSAKRSKVVRAIARYALVRRILTGTPVDEGPLDLFSQLEFLDPAVLGFVSFPAYRAFVAEYKQERTLGGRLYPKLVRYKNLDVVQQKMTQAYPGIKIRLLRREVSDGPEKIYVKRRFNLTEVQRNAYDELKNLYVTQLSGMEQVTADHVLTRWTRLQQIASNRVPIDLDARICSSCDGTDDECEECDGLGFVAPSHEERIRTVDPDKDPRLDALVQELSLDNAPTIIWAKFRSDVDCVVEAARKAGRVPVRYDGSVSVADRSAAILAFADGTADDFCANLSVRRGGRGLRLSRARKIIYYSNSFSKRVRGQSEDRAEDTDRTSADEGTTIVDLIANDTIDERIVEAHRNKQRVSDLILGDDPREMF